MSHSTSNPIPLSSIPTLSDLYKTSRLHPAPTDPSLPSPSASLNAKISLIRADITTLAVTSIVNAANNSLLGGGGVDGAIHSAAGPSLLPACRALSGCPTGSAKATPAFRLPCAHILHAVGPVYTSAKRKRPGLEKELLAGAYRRCLELAAERGGSVAFSCLSTGIYGYPSGEAAEVAAEVVREFLVGLEEGREEGGLERVVFCCFLEKDVAAYEESLPRWFPPAQEDLVPREGAESSGANPAPTATATNTELSEQEDTNDEAIELGKDDWVPVERPIEKSEDTMEESMEMSEEGEKIESRESVGETSEGGEVSEGDGVKVEVPTGIRGNPPPHPLLKDW